MPYLYKITNVVDEMCYYGVVHGHNKTVQQRFEEHLAGRGGKYLFKYGVQVHGPSCFEVKTLLEGSLEEVLQLEIQLTRDNLWPVGYNGNCGKAIVCDPETRRRGIEKRTSKYDIGELLKPVPPNWKGKTRSVTMKHKLSVSKTGTTHSNETKDKIKLKRAVQKIPAESYRKRLATLQHREDAFNRKMWLILKDNTIWFSVGGKNKIFSKMGVTGGALVEAAVNTNIPIDGKKTKAKGWKVFNNRELVIAIVKERADNVLPIDDVSAVFLEKIKNATF